MTRPDPVKVERIAVLGAGAIGAAEERLLHKGLWRTHGLLRGALPSSLL